MSTENPVKIPKQFNCLLCDYSTSNSKDYKKHINNCDRFLENATDFWNTLKIRNLYSVVLYGHHNIYKT